MLGCKRVTQTYRASKKIITIQILKCSVFSGNYKRAQLTNQPEIEIAQNCPFFIYSISSNKHLGAYLKEVRRALNNQRGRILL